MSEPGIHVYSKRVLQYSQCFVGFSSVNEKLCFQPVDSQIKRIEFSGPFYFGERFRVPCPVGKQVRIKEVSLSVVRIKLQGSVELVFGCVPIPIVPEYGEAEFGMSFGERVVNFDGLLRCRLRLREELA